MLGVRKACRELSDSLREIQRENDQLKADNAKLREYITRLEQANIVLDSDNCDLRNDMRDMQFFIAENAKLRKLIGAYHEYCLCNQYSKKSAHQLIAEIEGMIRELGIKVEA